MQYANVKLVSDKVGNIELINTVFDCKVEMGTVKITSYDEESGILEMNDKYYCKVDCLCFGF